jgi:hypothetical protein
MGMAHCCRAARRPAAGSARVNWIAARPRPGTVAVVGSRLCLAFAAGLLSTGGLAGVSTAAGRVTTHSAVGAAAPGSTVLTYPQAPAAEQTHPLVLPRSGKRVTRFAMYFMLREQPGHHGVLSISYRIAVGRPPHTRSRCQPAAPPNITSGHTGAVVRVILSTPSRGWCAGRYSVTVFLQRGPYCPVPAPGEPPTPCPEFALQDLDAGHAQFIVQTN